MHGVESVDMMRGSIYEDRRQCILWQLGESSKIHSSEVILDLILELITTDKMSEEVLVGATIMNLLDIDLMNTIEGTQWDYVGGA